MADIYFPPRELAVMSVLWRLGSGSVSEVREALEEDLAYTSVLSALQTLEEKGYITRDFNGPRSIVPTDFDLTLSREPLDAWAELFERRFWTPREWHKER